VLLDHATAGVCATAGIEGRICRPAKADPRDVGFLAAFRRSKHRSFTWRFRRRSAIEVDANQLELALINLAVNARDAMPQGGSLTIACHNEENGKRIGLPRDPFVCITVTDTGEGMSEATLARAQEPFFTTKGVGKGTGLGLSMVHGFTAQSGGTMRIGANRARGRRSRFGCRVRRRAARQQTRNYRLRSRKKREASACCWSMTISW
jgi:Signal transduction histidine kinase